MSDSRSWWANKLGNTQPQRYGIPIQPAQPAPIQQTVQQQPVQQQPVQQAPVTPGYQKVLDPNRPSDAQIPLAEALQLWQGGEAHRVEGNMACPDCGSTTGYTAYSGRAAGSVRVAGNKPRPHCFECGYNGEYSQGLQSNWS